MTAAPVLAKTLKFKLTVVDGDKAGQSFSFEKPVVTIGRGPENDMVFGNDPKMSRSHVEIRHHLGQLIIRNVSQKNFLLVNGEKVEEKTANGDALLLIGETKIQLSMEMPANLQASIPQSTAQPVPLSKAHPVQQVPRSQPLQAHQPLAAPSPFAKQPPPPPPPRAPRQSTVSSSGGNSRVRFYGIVLAIGGLIFWLVSSSPKNKKPEVHLRTEGDVVRAIEESAHAVQELKKQQEASGQNSLQYKSAQEQYIKGFRDYRQGQYSRAMQSFQAALSFYPNHELARKYLLQSQRKFEAQIDFNLAQGRKYYQKQNYRMCQSSFASVMMMLRDSTKPKYKEAKELYDECSLRMEGDY